MKKKENNKDNTKYECKLNSCHQKQYAAKYCVKHYKEKMKVLDTRLKLRGNKEDGKHNENRRPKR